MSSATTIDAEEVRAEFFLNRGYSGSLLIGACLARLAASQCYKTTRAFEKHQ